MTNFYAIIPAGGIGKRFGGDTKKQFLKIAGKTLLQRTVDVFLESNLFKKIVVCLPADDISSQGNLPEASTIAYVEGGSTRAESVFNGFNHIQAEDDDVVVIHDAVRPLLDVALIQRVADKARSKGSAIPVVPISDTVKRIDRGCVQQTLNRENLYGAQTPQGFVSRILKKGYAQLGLSNGNWTDEAMLVESIGEKIYIVEGDPKNIKVTTPIDLKIGEILIKGNKKDLNP